MSTRVSSGVGTPCKRILKHLFYEIFITAWLSRLSGAVLSRHGAKLWDYENLPGLQAAWLSMDHSQCLKCGNVGKGANESLAKDGLNSICVYSMPAGRLPISEWLAMIEIVAVTCFVICQCSVATGDGHQQVHCYAINGSWDPEILSLFNQNSWVACLNPSVFIFSPF